MLKILTIENFKSIYQNTIELGQLNVFIGENGSGKSNLLEALAFFSAAKGNRLDVEGLYTKGVRVAKPTLTFSSFQDRPQVSEIRIEAQLQNVNNGETGEYRWRSILTADTRKSFFEWLDMGGQGLEEEAPAKKLIQVYPLIKNYLIYHLDTRSLRGLVAESKKTPVGIHGEGLDLLLADFSAAELAKLKEYSYLISWLDEIVLDEEDLMRFAHFKLGKSTSRLYFKDKFMRKNNSDNIFSAENSNDGILHILCYLALFISQQTPQLFAIDNIESNLNPHLCTHLIDVLCQLAKDNHKQVLITTHNPAILDGLDLNDDDIRLFEVYRSDTGYTKTRRIQLNPATKPVKMKLSELWMRGYLGAISKQF